MNHIGVQFTRKTPHSKVSFHLLPGRRKKIYTGKPKARDVFLEGKNVPLHRKHLDVLFYYNFDSDILSSEKSSTILHIAQLNKQKKFYLHLKKQQQLISVIIQLDYRSQQQHMMTNIKNKKSFEMNKYTFIGSTGRGKKKPGANCRDRGLANNLWCLRPCGSRNVNRNHVKHSHCVYTASNNVSPLCCKQLKWLRPAGGEP